MSIKGNFIKHNSENIRESNTCILKSKGVEYCTLSNLHLIVLTTIAIIHGQTVSDFLLKKTNK